MAVLYRRVMRAEAQIVLREGFRDEQMRDAPAGVAGVWVSDVPLEAYDFGGGPEFDTVLRIELPDEDLAADCECV